MSNFIHYILNIHCPFKDFIGFGSMTNLLKCFKIVIDTTNHDSRYSCPNYQNLHNSIVPYKSTFFFLSKGNGYLDVTLLVWLPS